jgi:Ser/Thr protein kinase RdoA (MazF antagonist)
MSIEMENSIYRVVSEKYPVRINQIEQITNEMFRCSDDEFEYYARITNYKPCGVQNEEIQWMSFLNKHGVGVPSVILSYEGNMVEKGNFLEEKWIVLFNSAKGIHLPRSSWNGEIFKELGRQIGRMHRVTSQYELLNKIEYIEDWYESDEYQFLKHIPMGETIIRKFAQKVLEEIQAIPKDNHTYGLLHGDIWLENVLVANDSELTLIDFQNCEKHYYLYDLAVPIYSALEYSFSGNGNLQDYRKSITDSLFGGYAEEHSIPIGMMEKLPLFFKLKELFEYSQMHMCWDHEKLSEEQVRLLNHYRFRLENNILL